MRQFLLRAFLAGGVSLATATGASAAEYALTTYGLGGNAFGAGITPPPGTYVTEAAAFFSGNIGTSVSFGGVTLNPGAKLDLFSGATNILYVPNRKVLGGNLGLSVTLPVVHTEIDATLGGPFGLSRSVEGWGFGDVWSKVQLGWQHGDFAHTVYVQAVAPTGRWERGFFPINGLHRPGIDTGWAFTWTDKTKKLQINGATGFLFNFENTATDYKSGNEFHFEWAIGLEFAPGLLIGVVGFDYRQLTGDSGSGDLLGPFKGRVDAIGPGLIYTTLLGQTPFILNVRHYHEFNAHNHFGGNSTILSGTVRF